MQVCDLRSRHRGMHLRVVGAPGHSSGNDSSSTWLLLLLHRAASPFPCLSLLYLWCFMPFFRGMFSEELPACCWAWMYSTGAAGAAVPSMAQPSLSSQIPLRPQQHLGTGMQHSKVSPSPTSYHAQCAVLPGDQYCGGRLEKPSGSFQTPNWPERDYPAGVTCSWHIVAPKNQVMHCPTPPPSPAATHRGATQAALVVKIPPG